MSPPLRIALYGEINMNLIDGSSVWLQSMAQTLTYLRGSEVTVLLKFPDERDVLTEPLRATPGIEVVEPGDLGKSGPLDSAEAAAALERLDSERGFDLLLLRGPEVSEEACNRASLAGRLWLYFLPSSDGPEGRTTERLRSAAPAAARILCQTEAVRESAEAIVPEQAEKLILLPPMIPPPAARRPLQSAERPLRLIYAGKFAPEYQFLEMVSLFEMLRREEPEARLDVVGDKIHNPPDDPTFRAAAEAALERTENLIWHGALSRDGTQALLREADVALSIRHPRMLHSRELSTKVLEYGAAGCAVVLNRTPLYEELLGSDYPLFASDRTEALDALLGLRAEPALRIAAAERCEVASREYVYERVAARLEPHLPRAATADATGKPRLVIAGHDLKFVPALRAALSAGAEVNEDLWEGHTQHSPDRSRELLSWADVVLCEWCLGNAVWYSRNVGEDQRLAIRFHRVELETPYPREVDSDRVGTWVFVAEHVREEATRRFSLPGNRQLVIPNIVDVDRFARPKLPDSTFNLAMIGFVPSLKRTDLALDILERLRAADPRFRLILKGNPPWKYHWVMKREEEHRHYEDIYRRIARSPLLRDSVSFEPFGTNVPAFLRKIRFLLSTSDIEGDQVAVAEAAASAAIPVVLERPGAADQYPPSWVHPSPDAAAEAILDFVYEQGAEAEAVRALEFASERWSGESLAPLWAEALGLAPEREPEPAQAS